MNIYIRHGEAIHNTDEKFYAYGDDTLLTLTPKGFQDAVGYVPKLVEHARLRHPLSELGLTNLSIVSSDSLRAVQTATLIHSELRFDRDSFAALLGIEEGEDPKEYHAEFQATRVTQDKHLREFYYEVSGDLYRNTTRLSGGFNYGEYKDDVDYERGLAVPFRQMVTSRKYPKAPDAHTLQIAVSHHYAVAAAICDELLKQDRRTPGDCIDTWTTNVMRLCMENYIHKGLVYDLDDLSAPYAQNRAVPSALWAGLIDAGAEKVMNVREVERACAELWTELHGPLPERYHPANRVSYN